MFSVKGRENFQKICSSTRKSGITSWEGVTLKGKRGREELLLSYFIVTSPARRALETHPLHITFNTKKWYCKFLHNGLWQTGPGGDGNYRGFAALSVSPRNVNM